MEEKGLIFGDEVYAIVGAAMEVHTVLGTGFLEAVYQSALKLELRNRNIPFEFEKELPVLYKGQRLDTLYRADLICYGKIIVELKALDRLTGKEESQIINYLKATGFRVGVLINFGSRGKLEWKRFVN
ncbi:MAG TPA: GxxExxY protein [Blastocatellia bacterium]|nr:GxxExxY protein [Blastocatellia bacterium]HMX26745.1 GxxExxY protein [Blastocatellia bacterium]HMY72869.1 GxxExxY protein [Blastocatellia bacterium]HMZ16561.1 GxxExxY protein [Blastocatellia bacterium]HNG31643.1 GxxExxY protein [Blastocatellia bacterium]